MNGAARSLVLEQGRDKFLGNRSVLAKHFFSRRPFVSKTENALKLRNTFATSSLQMQERALSGVPKEDCAMRLVPVAYLITYANAVFAALPLVKVLFLILIEICFCYFFVDYSQKI